MNVDESLPDEEPLDPEDQAELLRNRELCLDRVQQAREQLTPWQGGRAMTMSYAHQATQSPLLNMPGNSVLEIRLVKDGQPGAAALRCMACWRVSFQTFWSPANIQVEYHEAALVPFLVTDGERLRVECADVELIEFDQ